MRFRPCIDIHNGKVKQIVGGSLQDQGDQAQENYVAEQDAPFFARLYQSRGIRGGHIILLNPATSPYYEATRQQAIEALKAYPGGMQIGGGIREDNAESFLDAGASHVIVTSYVFKNGVINWENLEKLERAVGRKHLVLDLSCRKKDGQYYIVTDRWQKFTQVPVSEQTIEEFSSHCDEFLVHAVDVEGKAEGIEKELAAFLGVWGGTTMTYAGGVHSYRDLWYLSDLTQGKMNVTIGSALDIFGGKLKWDKVLEMCKVHKNYADISED